MDLSKKQLSLLKSLQKEDIIKSEPHYDEDLAYLIKNDLVTLQAIDQPGDYMYHARISPLGRALLYERRRSDRKSNLSILISVASILISVCSLLLTLLVNWDAFLTTIRGFLQILG